MTYNGNIAFQIRTSRQEVDNSEQSIIRRFKTGDKAAADALISRYYDRVVRAAKRRLQGVRIRASSEEDIAASVFESLWKLADQNRLGDSDLVGPDELWRLLSTLVRFKARDHVRNERRQKRGGDQLRGESVFGDPENNAGIDGLEVREESIASFAAFREQHLLLMDKLEDDDLREIVTMRLEGYKVKEIADHFDRSERWVKRKLAMIRNCWVDELEPDDGQDSQD